MTKSILIIGGTGAQGSAIVRHLSSLGTYSIKVLTGDPSSSHAQALASLANVTSVPGGRGTHNEQEAHLTSAIEGMDYVWVNTNGFALGEMAETYWGIRMFELSVRAGVKHFIYSGIEGAYKKSGYDPTMRVGHFEGKARVSAWIQSQPTSPMAWTILDSGAYLESLSEMFAPKKGDDGSYTFILPIGNGAIPMISLADKAKYVDWAFSHPEKSNGLYIALATTHVSGADLAKTFTAVTGKPATHLDVPAAMWMQAAFGKLPNGVETKVGYLNAHDDALIQTYAEDFGNWFNLYRATNADNTGLLTRDYDALDKILPGRVKSLEEWMRLVGYTGEKEALLKDLAQPARDGGHGQVEPAHVA